MIRYLTEDIKFSSDYSNESDEEEIIVKHHDGSSFLQKANLCSKSLFKPTAIGYYLSNGSYVHKNISNTLQYNKLYNTLTFLV